MHDGDSPEDGWDVFISFATEDQRYAEELKERLDEQDWKVFLAHESVRHGARWRQRIPRALLNSRLVAVLLSERSARARYQDSEIVRAIEAEERGELEITPIYLEGKPDGIRGWDFGLEGYQSLDLSRLSMGEVAERLGERLGELGARSQSNSSVQEVGDSLGGEVGKVISGEERGVSLARRLVLVLGFLAALLGFVWLGPLLYEQIVRSWDVSRPEMIRIPAGSFQMGDQDSPDEDERPVHPVTVASFEISKTEVTVAQYRACVEAGKCLVPDQGSLGSSSGCTWNAEGKDDHPVNCLSWDAAKAYAEWIGGRLPSEAEWEFAARSGGLDQAYPWGDTEPTCELAVVDGCGLGTQPVCSKTGGNTEQGLCDMAGNVWEWVEDDWHDTYTGAPKDGSARVDSPRASNRVIRGGSWRYVPRNARVAYRSWVYPSYRYVSLGFRVARSLPSAL